MFTSSPQLFTGFFDKPPKKKKKRKRKSDLKQNTAKTFPGLCLSG
jgi:hypothetical protein